MPAPPGLSPAASARLIERGGSPEAVHPARRVSTLMAQARTYRQLDHLSNKRLSVLVNAYVSREIDGDFVLYVLGYADPTGETAVRNVVRERGW